MAPLAKRNRITITFVVILFSALIGVGGVQFLQHKQMSDLPGELIADLGNKHIAEVTSPHIPYNSIPPTSGPHLPRINQWGVVDHQISDELQVHNLEDGGVIVHYDPVRVDGATIEKLQQLLRSYSDRVILEPYTRPAMSTPLALTAWTRIEKLKNFDEARIKKFIEAYRGIDHHIQGAE